MNKRNENALALAGLLLGLLALGWWLGAQTSAKSTTNDLPLSKSTTQAVSAQDASIRHVRATTSTPAQTILQSERYAQLSSAAAKDAKAAYQLAQGIEACFRLRGAQWQLNNWFKEPTSSDSHSDKAISAEKTQMEKLANTAREHCIGDTNISWDQVNEALSHAAKLGSHEAQYQYAINPRLNVLAAANDLDHWRDWRDHAPGYLQSAVQRGDATAVLTMAAASDQQDCNAQNPDSAHDPCAQGSLIGMILPQDAAIAYRYYVLYQLLGVNANAAWVQSQLASLASLLSASEIADATAQAQQLYAQMHPAGP
ncbi:MAG: hypothetical protein ACREPN_00305 [Rudaea sp.]